VVPFIKRVQAEDADRFVVLAIQRAVTEIAGGMSLQQLIETDDARPAIQTRAQQILDSAQCGVTLTEINILRKEPPFAIRRAFNEVQQSRVQAGESIQRAREDAQKTLIKTAGNNYAAIISLIDQYQAAIGQNQAAEAEAILAKLNATFENSQGSSGAAEGVSSIAGDVDRVIQRARSYRAEVASTMGSQATRFEALLDAYHKNPAMVVKKLWLEAYANVLNRPTNEVFFVPSDGGPYVIHIASLDQVADARQRSSLDQKQREQNQLKFEAIDYINTGADVKLPGQGPGRLIDVTPTGEIIRPRR
jgi:regulator of protease activity HflC (stomatin/prohibitin superfamily)